MNLHTHLVLNNHEGASTASATKLQIKHFRVFRLIIRPGGFLNYNYGQQRAVKGL